MRKFLLSVAAAMTVGGAFAAPVVLSVDDASGFKGTYVEEVPAEGSKNGTAAHYQPLEELMMGDYTFTFSSTNENASSQPAYYYPMSTNATAAKTIRVYKDTKMTVTAPAGVSLEKVVLKGSNGKSDLTITVDAGEATYADQVVTWTGAAASSVSMTFSGTFRITSVEINGDGGNETPDTPVVEGKKFNLAKEMSAGSFVMVVGNQVAQPIAASKTYGYLYVEDCAIENGVATAPEADIFTFNAVEGGYTIQMSDGRYLYMKGSYDSFNLANEVEQGDDMGFVFSVSIAEDGTATVKNVLKDKTLAFDSNYSSFGAYSAEKLATNGAVLPMLYKLAEETPSNYPAQIYLIGSPQNWDINNGSIILAGNDGVYTGKVNIEANKFQLRFYKELGSWDNGSIGSLEGDEHIAIEFTDGVYNGTCIDGGKGAWDVMAWPGGDVDLTVDLKNGTVKFETSVEVVPPSTDAPEQIYLIGAPSGWSVTADTMPLKETTPGSKIYVGAYEIAKDKFQFRFYSYLGDWETNSIGSQDADSSLDIAMTDGVYEGPCYWEPGTLKTGKGSWQIPGWETAMVYMTVDLNNKTVRFALNGAVEGIDAENAAVTVYNLQGVCLLRNADAEALNGLAEGIYIINGKKVMIKK